MRGNRTVDANNNQLSQEKHYVIYLEQYYSCIPTYVIAGIENNNLTGNNYNFFVDKSFNITFL